MNENTNNLRERLASPLTWHYVGVAVLLGLVIFLATRFGFDWAATSARTRDSIAEKQVQLHALQLQTAPLRGVDKRVVEASTQVKDFYGKRIPADYSEIAKHIGDLEVKSGVRLTRLQYVPKAAQNNLSEITMDAGITGEYPQIMRFINSLERDKIFFVIRGMGLTGQQGGAVNLRLQVSTWLRPAAGADLPPEQSAAAGASSDANP